MKQQWFLAHHGLITIGQTRSKAKQKVYYAKKSNSTCEPNAEHLLQLVLLNVALAGCPEL